MAGPLDGIRILEIASWMFVPSGGSVLVDWGADVIKVEPIAGGDPQRGLITSGLLPGGAGGVNFMIEQPNRGKRSVAVDLTTPDGHEALMKLVETADVFLTNYLPQVRAKLKIDTDDLRARNPNIIVARGSGNGPKGPEAHKGGYDGATFWARGGVGNAMPEREGGWPPGQPTPAFGDVMGGLATAGAIAAALLKRERTGETSVVDVSLLATAMWQVSPMIIASKLFGFSKIPQGDRMNNGNPGVGTYRTGRRPLHLRDPPAVGQVLGGLHQAPRRARHGHRPAVLRRHRPGRERAGLHRAARRGLRQPAPLVLEGGAGHLRRRVERLPDLRRAVRRRAGPGQRLPAVDGGRQRRHHPAGGQPRPVRRGGRRGHARPRAGRAHRARAPRRRVRLGPARRR